MIRIAETFNISVDYLLFTDAGRRPLNAPSSHLDARLTDLDQLTDDERTTITNFIDDLVTKPNSASSPAPAKSDCGRDLQRGQCAPAQAPMASACELRRRFGRLKKT